MAQNHHHEFSSTSNLAHFRLKMCPIISSAKCKNNPEEEKTRCKYEFPDGGWECSMCNNYNFKGRRMCFRCKKVKSVNDVEGKPKHMKESKQKKLDADEEDDTNNDERVVNNPNYKIHLDNRVLK